MGNLQSFFESGKGQISVIAVIVVFFLLALIPPKNQKTPGRGADVKALTISALMVAAAIVLGQFKLFSMPQGGLDALLNKDPLDILAYQYDIVCNGVELSSGAVRNHDLDIMQATPRRT